MFFLVYLRFASSNVLCYQQSGSPFMDPASTPTSTPASSTQQPSLQATGFVQNENGILVPIYGNEALEQYTNGSRSSSTSSGLNGSTPVMWQGAPSPTFAVFPPWLPPPTTGQVPVNTMIPGLFAPSSISDWDVSSQTSSPQPPFPPVNLHAPPLYPQAANPYMLASMPGFPGTSSHSSSSTAPSPMLTHLRPRPLQGNKRTRSHVSEGNPSSQSIGISGSGGHGPTLHQMMKLNKQQQSIPGGGSQPRGPSSSNLGLPAVGAARPTMTPVFSYPPYPFAPNLDGAGVVPSPGLPFFNPNPNHPQPKHITPNVNPAQWNVVPAAYENP